ncbi:acetate/propionate family kinase [Mesorhizobium sp. ASY16-5R]|uniref:acetate/propionate family kinase n=1 Tax=Mesorhizobium sp. ASY16-5R TaxID=3445772 RepID=UPI003FA08585
MQATILALNAGSSSIKFGIFDIGGGDLTTVARGMLDIDKSSRLVARAGDGSVLLELTVQGDGLPAGIAAMLDWIETEFGNRRIVACGHRIVHGGSTFFKPSLLTSARIDAIEALSPLAPLHQPRNIAPIRALSKLRPGLPQVGCFDTAFHRTMQPPASRYALPRPYEEKGIRRYGFHGLSYEFIAGKLHDEGRADRRTIVAHLGNGASLCAMRYSRSVDTTMGFSALDGLVMGTRCGTIDPGVLLYLLQHEGMRTEELERLLYRESGLLGVSGTSGDMRDLEASKAEHAREAVELFVFRAARETAALANTLGGLDCIVFTAGIGEHSAGVRRSICDRLGWLGVVIDKDANDRHEPVVSASTSTVEVCVVATDEESIIARHTLGVISGVSA